MFTRSLPSISTKTFDKPIMFVFMFVFIQRVFIKKTLI